MPYCSRCGVELDNDVSKCPLCETPVQILSDRIPPIKKYPDQPVHDPDSLKLSGKQLRLFIWEILTVSLMLPALVVFFTDLVTGLNITWARYPILALLMVWGLASFPILFYKIPVILVFSEVIVLNIFLWAIDFFIDGAADWYFLIALPILILATLVVGSVVLASVLSQKKGANIAGFCLIGIGFLGLGLDMIIESGLYNRFQTTWSVYVLIPSLSLAAVLLYFHYRILSLTDVSKRFHL
ncbi:MAG: hypothetical protein JXR70_02190 [Spirochaetales bacterium]|nr:hypothetical protein [Spirochaetales bacterium]